MYLCVTELFSIEQIIYIKMDLALNSLQRLICHKTHQTLTKPNLENMNNINIEINRSIDRYDMDILKNKLWNTIYIPQI